MEVVNSNGETIFSGFVVNERELKTTVRIFPMKIELFDEKSYDFENLRQKMKLITGEK